MHNICMSDVFCMYVCVCCMHVCVCGVDLESLEQVLRRAVVKGQPRTHRPWRKIIVLVEGVYRLKKKSLECYQFQVCHGCHFWLPCDLLTYSQAQVCHGCHFWLPCDLLTYSQAKVCHGYHFWLPCWPIDLFPSTSCHGCHFWLPCDLLTYSQAQVYHGYHILVPLLTYFQAQVAMGIISGSLLTYWPISKHKFAMGIISGSLLTYFQAQVCHGYHFLVPLLTYFQAHVVWKCRMSSWWVEWIFVLIEFSHSFYYLNQSETRNMKWCVCYGVFVA